VLVVIDTLRRDHLASYGYARDTAPGLRRLGEQGAVFDGVSVTSWTKPAVASILTGLHPLRHGALLEDGLPGEAVTLAERLREQGFHTLGISSNAHITAAFGFDQGFDELVALMPDFDSGASPRPADVNRELLARLDRLQPPFFLYLHYLDPHAPYEPETAWDGSPLPERLVARGALRGVDLAQRSFRPRDPALVRDAVDLYDGEIRGVDDHLAAALEALAARGLDRRTLTIVTADHGEEFEEHGRMGHGKTLHAESVNVPLILHAPGSVPAGSGGGVASVLDVVPTALALLGAPEGETRLDGESLVPRIRGAAPPGDRELLLHLDLREVGRLGALALQRGDEKLILSRSPYARQLHDLGADPGEERDLAAEHPERVAELGRRLAERYAERHAGALPRAEARVDAHVREALAALGYVGSGGEAGPDAAPLPETVRPTDPRRSGALGWESAGPEAACLEPAGPGAVGQLLEGWLGPEQGGRWTEPVAGLTLGRPGPGPLRLRLEGVNPTPAPLRIRLGVEDGDPRDAEARPGPFELELAVGAPDDRDPLAIRLERLPPLVPGRVGSRGREGVGVFLTRVCLLSG